MEAWADIQKHAALRFNTAVISEFQKRYQIRNIQRTADLLRIIDKTDNQTAAAAKWRGFTIELTPENTQLLVYSTLQAIYIQNVKLYRKEATAAVDGAVFDLLTGERIYQFTIPANTTAGWTTVKIEQRFAAYQVYVAFDSTAVDCVELDINESATSAFNGCAAEYFGDGCYTRLRGAESDDKSTEVSNTELTKGNNTYGLSGVFSVVCSYEPVVESNKQTFLLAWAYNLATSLLWFRLNSSTTNRWTLGIDKEKGEKLMAEMESLFQQEMATTMDGISLDLDDSCLECNEPFTHQISLP